MHLLWIMATAVGMLGPGARPPEPPRARESVAKATRLGGRLRVELLTMGPGTEAYSRFGHSALRVTDLRGVGDIVFNFGTFDDKDPAVVSKFLAGTLRYWLSFSTFAETRREYRQERRRLVAQELRLTPLQRRRLFVGLYAQSKPAHRHYRYHHFRANCSTRIRDALDDVTGGALRRQLSRRPARTYRHWIRRTTRGAPAFHLGFDLVLTRADARITAWEACFAPEQLMHAMATLRVTGAAGERSFVARTRELLPGPAFGDVGGPAPWTLAVGGAWLLLLVALLPLALRPGRPWAWRVTGVALGLWGLVTAALSALMIYIWSVSNLRVFSGNQNLLLLPPTQLLWAVLGVVMVVRAGAPARGGLARGLVWLGGAHALVALLYAGARLVGLCDQGNAPILAAALPWALALVWILGQARAE